MQDPAVKHLVEVLTEDMRNRMTGGLERFLTALALDGGRKDFEEWASLPWTKVYLDALKSLGDTVPNANPSDHAGLAKAVGCHSGINLAVKLAEDPTRIFPSIYDGAGVLASRAAKPVVDETYEESPEGEEQEKQNKEKK